MRARGAVGVFRLDSRPELAIAGAADEWRAWLEETGREAQAVPLLESLDQLGEDPVRVYLVGSWATSPLLGPDLEARARFGQLELVTTRDRFSGGIGAA